MEERTVDVPGGQCTVSVDGPDSGHTVVLLPARGSAAGDLDTLRERLHTSDLRSVVITAAHEMSDADVLGVLDELGLPWVNLVGMGDGADRAWSLAARTFGRVVSLVIVDGVHPAAAQPDPDASFPAVEVRTTIVATKESAEAGARASGRWVYGDFRVVTLAGDPTTTAAAGLATEIVMRTSAW